MNAERFRRLMDLVGDATEMAAHERPAWLVGQCGDDPELLAEATALLEGATSSAAMTAKLDAQIARTAAQLTTRPMSKRIGPYAITHVLGEGGMGIVYGAHQEAPLKRDVALKVIRTGPHAPRLIALFEAERHTLASLDHPNIAQIFDAGTTDEGLPYFAMEWVRGEPITHFCASRALGIAERLRLFQDVLAAVQYAHQKAVVHRDLKPSNVLVADIGGRPTPKVIDFGVAKVMSDDSGAAVSRTTRGVGVGTLEYMSPEQAIGHSGGVDTRSDIYSLGVLLYELIAGRLPFPGETLRSASPTELERLFRDTDPPAPSTFTKAVSADLDNIVGMAMRKEPARRYATVAQFSDDISRYREGRPVIAHPATATYRVRRFVGRHRIEVVGTAAALLLVTTVTAVFTVRLARERDRATLEAAKSSQVAAFLQELFTLPDPSANGRDVSARQLLDQGAQRIETELVGQPVLQAGMLRVMGTTYFGLGLYPEAARLDQKALALQRKELGDRDVEVARTLHMMGRVQVAGRRVADGTAALREALAIRQDVLGPGDTATASTETALALALRALGQYDEAETLARSAVEVERRSRPQSRELADALHNLAFVLRSENKEDEAEPVYREALTLRRRLLDPSHPDLLSTMANLAVLLGTRGEYAEAESLHREVLARRRERLGMDHPLTVQALSNLATNQYRSGKFPGAEAAYREAITVARRVYGGDNGTLAIMINNLGVVTRRAGKLAESETLHREALEMNRRLKLQSRIPGDMDNLGRTLLARGDIAGAIRLHQDALALRSKLLGADNVDVAESMAALGDARLAQGHLAEADSLFRKALALRTAKLRAQDPRVAQSDFDLATALRARRQYAEAEQLLRTTLAIRTALLGDAHPDVAVTMRELGAVLRLTGRYKEADALLTESRRITVDRLGSTHPDTKKIDREIEALHQATRENPGRR